MDRIPPAQKPLASVASINGARLSEPRPRSTALDFDEDNEDVDIEDTDEVEVEFSNLKTGQEPSRAG
ncbi:hypothetical protein BGZ65_001748 [Modicella reniformis]|uniref:Uncharacterized protein n=1 Tax=Modicella reniformis TaxID=1440133 RepID=A0A9P6MJL7_9FUNG|nr:hypothetical protein BGZ65_001748 [Modicella reniformis]